MATATVDQIYKMADGTKKLPLTSGLKFKNKIMILRANIQFRYNWIFFFEVFLSRL
jgi:hypothetical protein